MINLKIYSFRSYQEQDKYITFCGDDETLALDTIAAKLKSGAIPY